MKPAYHTYHVVKYDKYPNTYLIEGLNGEVFYKSGDKFYPFLGASALLTIDCNHDGTTQLYMSYRHNPDEEHGSFSIDFNPLYNKDGEYIVVDIKEECPYLNYSEDQEIISYQDIKIKKNSILIYM